MLTSISLTIAELAIIPSCASRQVPALATWMCALMTAWGQWCSSCCERPTCRRPQPSAPPYPTLSRTQASHPIQVAWAAGPAGERRHRPGTSTRCNHQPCPPPQPLPLRKCTAASRTQVQLEGMVTHLGRHTLQAAAGMGPMRSVCGVWTGRCSMPMCKVAVHATVGSRVSGEGLFGRCAWPWHPRQAPAPAGGLTSSMPGLKG